MARSKMTVLGWSFNRVQNNDSATTDWEFTNGHEKNSVTHVRKFQERLDAFTSAPVDPGDLQSLKDHLDVQLKIEELLLKSRISEHTKWQVYGPFVVPLVTAVLGLLIGYVSRR